MYHKPTHARTLFCHLSMTNGNPARCRANQCMAWQTAEWVETILLQQDQNPPLLAEKIGDRDDGTTEYEIELPEEERTGFCALIPAVELEEEDGFFDDHHSGSFGTMAQ